MNLPYAEAAQQNKQVIYQAISGYLAGDVLEIGSGTGQHAVYFAGRSPAVSWQTSDLGAALPGLEAQIRASGLDNLPPPIELDVTGAWPRRLFDLVYTANSLHIMSRAMVEACFAGVGDCLQPGGVFAAYGPFNYHGEYTSPSNASFDHMLRSRDPSSGIKDYAWLAELAVAARLELLDDIEMPVNNRTLVWKKRT